LTHAELRSLALAVLAAFLAIILFSGCETGGVSTRSLPAYEPPIAKSEFQNVRTTAYTHSESDHTQYGARNALGGALHPAGPAFRRAENVRQARAISTDNDDTDVINISSSDAKLEKFSMDKPKKATRVTTTVTTTRVTKKTAVAVTRDGKRAVAASKSPRIGSAAADWSRWPMGTTFRLLSTGQMYRVEDYGWALSGRNTIDLYMANQRDMNTWGARQEPIQILHWGDPQQSLQVLQSHAEHKHIKRMVLELQGRDQEAAALQ
jgi:3D (Asp-Asp-Asp) domain-containing protein